MVHVSLEMLRIYTPSEMLLSTTTVHLLCSAVVLYLIPSSLLLDAAWMLDTGDVGAAAKFAKRL
jgi:hypothetical protein